MDDAKKHYDEVYARGDYAERYTELEAWAVNANAYHAHMVAGILELAPGARVLDLGSGMGHYVRAWQRAGFACRGVELSSVAVERSPMREHLDIGDATDLSRYPRDSFDLVFSSMLLEHLTDAQVERLVRTGLELAPYMVHFIAHSAGGDPGHINVKSPQEWTQFFRRLKVQGTILPNGLFPEVPMFLISRGQLPPVMMELTRMAEKSLRKRR